MRRPRPKQWTVRPSLQWSLDAINAPAILGNDRSDLLAANHLGRAMYSGVYAGVPRPPNFARFTFLDSAAHRFYPDWGLAADMTVANLRTAAGKDPHDKGLQDLVGELSTAVTNSAAGGVRIMCAPTAPASSSSTITWSAT